MGLGKERRADLLFAAIRTTEQMTLDGRRASGISASALTRPATGETGPWVSERRVALGNYL